MITININTVIPDTGMVIVAIVAHPTGVTYESDAGEIEGYIDAVFDGIDTVFGEAMADGGYDFTDALRFVEEHGFCEEIDLVASRPGWIVLKDGTVITDGTCAEDGDDADLDEEEEDE